MALGFEDIVPQKTSVALATMDFIGLRRALGATNARHHIPESLETKFGWRSCMAASPASLARAQHRAVFHMHAPRGCGNGELHRSHVSWVRTLLLSRHIASLLCSPLLPNSKSSEQSEEENDKRNHRWLDTERKNASRHLRLQVDIDCHAHLSKEDRTRDQQELISAFCGQRSSKPWQ